MIPEMMPVREWQENYRAGAYKDKDVWAQRTAGWSTWECPNGDLTRRLKEIARMIMKIKEPLILDGYSVYFSNNLSNRKSLYDNVEFEPMNRAKKDHFFMIYMGNEDERDRLTLYTGRYGLDTPEFGCERTRDMIQYISGMARELDQGIRPPFLEEKGAAAGYILRRDTVHPSRALRREGEHSYSFLDQDDGRRKILHVAASMEDTPPGFQAEGAVQINGFYVSCPDDAQKAVEATRPSKKKSHKKKEVER